MFVDILEGTGEDVQKFLEKHPNWNPLTATSAGKKGYRAAGVVFAALAGLNARGTAPTQAQLNKVLQRNYNLSLMSGSQRADMQAALDLLKNTEYAGTLKPKGMAITKKGMAFIERHARKYSDILSDIDQNRGQVNPLVQRATAAARSYTPKPSAKKNLQRKASSKSPELFSAGNTGIKKVKSLGQGWDVYQGTFDVSRGVHAPVKTVMTGDGMQIQRQMSPRNTPEMLDPVLLPKLENDQYKLAKWTIDKAHGLKGYFKLTGYETDPKKPLIVRVLFVAKKKSAPKPTRKKRISKKDKAETLDKLAQTLGVDPTELLQMAQSGQLQGLVGGGGEAAPEEPTKPTRAQTNVPIRKPGL